MKNIVNAQWLSAHINNEDVIIVDCRSSLVDKGKGYIQHILKCLL